MSVQRDPLDRKPGQSAAEPSPLEQELLAWKQQAGEAAAAQVHDGMVVGLGTGSTARWATLAIGRRLEEGNLRSVRGVPTSEATVRLAEEVGIPLTTLDRHARVDLCIDGADEVGPGLALVKGGGGALVREKIVARAARRMVVVADRRKVVERLGLRLALPVAIVPFGRGPAQRALEALGARVSLRQREGRPLRTDDGLHVLDAHFEDGIEDPEAVEDALCAQPEIVTTGLFLHLADTAMVADNRGVHELRADEGGVPQE